VSARTIGEGVAPLDLSVILVPGLPVRPGSFYKRCCQFIALRFVSLAAGCLAVLAALAVPAHYKQ